MLKGLRTLPTSRPGLFLVLCLFFTPLPSNAQTGSIQEFPTVFGLPQGIVAGPDGNVWLVEQASSKVAQVSTAGSLLREIALSPGSGPLSIVVGPDGNLWFTEGGLNRIGKLSVGGALLGEFQVASPPESIAAGPDGNLWFTEESAGKIGKMDTNGRLLGEFTIPTADSKPRGISVGPCGDGNLWFTEQNGRIGRIDTAGNIAEVANTGPASSLRGITPGPGGDCNLYIADLGQDCIVQMTTTGLWGVIFLPIGSGPTGVIAGPDGNIWFTEKGLNRIGHMTPTGVVRPEAQVPSSQTFPDGIAAGPDANIWFTEAGGNRVGRVITGVAAPPTPTPTPTPPQGPVPQISKTVVPRRETPAPRPFRTP